MKDKWVSKKRTFFNLMGKAEYNVCFSMDRYDFEWALPIRVDGSYNPIFCSIIEDATREEI